MEVIKVMDRLRMGRVPKDRYRPVRERHLKAGEENAAGKSVLKVMKSISPCGMNPVMTKSFYGKRGIKRKEEILKEVMKEVFEGSGNQKQ